MLAAIGETFEIPFNAESLDGSPPADSTTPLPLVLPDEITGVIVSSRKAFYRINIWTRSSNAESKARVENIGRHFKYGVLGLEQGLKISERDKVSSDVEFVSHKDSQAKVSTLTAYSLRCVLIPGAVRHQNHQVDRVGIRIFSLQLLSATPNSPQSCASGREQRAARVNRVTRIHFIRSRFIQHYVRFE